MSCTFQLYKTAFLEDGTLDESGNRQIVKRFIYVLTNPNATNFYRAMLDLADRVPRRGTAMSDDARYVMKSAKYGKYNNNAKSSCMYFIDATYRMESEDPEAAAPWNLAPFEVDNGYVEIQIPFEFGYNDQNQKVVPVCNSCGDKLDATETLTVRQFRFSYYLEDITESEVILTDNSVNSASQRLMGVTYSENTLLLLPVIFSKLFTYEDDGTTLKWEYYKMQVVIQYKADGWDRVFQNVGNRAIFDGKKHPEEILQWNKFVKASKIFASIPTFGNRNMFDIDDAEYQTWYQSQENKSGLAASMSFEYPKDVPLIISCGTTNGHIDTDALNGRGTVAYQTISRKQYAKRNWSALSLPHEVR